jgi:hypothetical protein
MVYLFLLIIHVMSRINRKDWLESDMGIKSSGGLLDLFDNQIKMVYRISDDEYDHLCGVMNEDEMNLFVKETPTFSEKRKMIELLNTHISYERN